MERKGVESPVVHREWTPEEIKGQNFRGSLVGFSRREVRDFLRLLSKLWSRMIEREQSLSSQVQKLEAEVAVWRAREKEIEENTIRATLEAQSIREHARVQAERLMSETEEKAAAIRGRTENWLEEVIAKVEETQRQKQNFLTAFRSALDSHYELIRSEESETEPLSAKLSDVLRGAPASLN
jgi:cell division initiation protein